MNNILNVTLLEPKLKHPTIFARFDELEGGEDLTIYNDHDPKPLYYQLLGERGNVFTWEYLEEGPEWWKVRIGKRIMGENDPTLRELAASDLRKVEVFKKYDLDFSCGGKKTVKEACAEKGMDVTKIEQELQVLDKSSHSHSIPYHEWNLNFLIDYIVNTHHRYIRKNLPEIALNANKVKKVHGARHPALDQVYDIIKKINSALLLHLQNEETILFPGIKELVTTSHEPNQRKAVDDPKIGQVIKAHEQDHQTFTENLREIRVLTGSYALPEDACNSFAVLYRQLEEFEVDAHLHIHLENNILFPKVLKLEKQENETY